MTLTGSFYILFASIMPLMAIISASLMMDIESTGG
jgi:hypothetical protein